MGLMQLCIIWNERASECLTLFYASPLFKKMYVLILPFFFKQITDMNAIHKIIQVGANYN